MALLGLIILLLDLSDAHILLYLSGIYFLPIVVFVARFVEVAGDEMHFGALILYNDVVTGTVAVQLVHAGLIVQHERQVRLTATASISGSPARLRLRMVQSILQVPVLPLIAYYPRLHLAN